MIEWIIIGLLLIIAIIVVSGIRTIRQTHRGIIETFGKYSGYRNPGLTYVIPFFQSLTQINITEQMSQIEPQEIITKDNLNAQVDLVVYYKIRKDEENLKNSLYEVNDVTGQLETLSRTTARNVIGTMEFKEVNSERKILNERLQKILAIETKSWGIDVLKVELKEILPPKDVQETMNNVIKAQNQKDAAEDLATAAETQADGRRRAAIKEAEGLAQGKIIVAKGQAESIRLVNSAASKYFKGNAQKLKALEVTQASLENNTKVVLTEKGIKPQIIIGDLPITKQ